MVFDFYPFLEVPDLPGKTGPSALPYGAQICNLNCEGGDQCSLIIPIFMIWYVDLHAQWR